MEKFYVILYAQKVKQIRKQEDVMEELNTVVLRSFGRFRRPN